MYGSRGYRVIAQGKALSLKSHRHAVHAMLHCPLPEDMKLFGVYPVRHAVMMQLRHDGKIGFPGGYVDDGETLESALRRELLEELGPGAASDRLAISETNYVVTHVHPDQRLCLHFYLKKIDHDVFINIEKRVHEGALYGLETQGIIRCPLYTLHDNEGGLPAFFENNFIGVAREQLIIGLENGGLLTNREINKALKRSET